MGTMLSMARCFTLVALCTKDLTLAHMLLGGGGAHSVSIRLHHHHHLYLPSICLPVLSSIVPATLP
ncbi:hypothetical protein NC652_003178 [Populus alba x Populus x berolinensis]|nr:hypothetical protein NC652_003178 [Populus alba x Populus x berolinensis]